MTKQEEIQRYLEDVINKAWRLGVVGRGIDLTGEAKASLNHLSLRGVVIKVEREPPRFGYSGWLVAVEPLIEEE